MKFLVPMLAAILTGITATAANAAGPESYKVPGWGAHSTAATNVRYRYGRYFDQYGRYFHVPRNCCVLGPAYGVPGEPLGPAYNTDLWMPNPRTCGPGACQDNPWY
jgi:hypothetical protein